MMYNGLLTWLLTWGTGESIVKHKLTPGFVLNPPMPAEGKDRVTYWDGNFGLMVMASGHRSFVVQYRAEGKTWRMSLKRGLSLQDARREAKAILGAVIRGSNPLREKRKVAATIRTTLKAVAEDYLKREGVKLRSLKERTRVLRTWVYPALGERQIESIKRSEITRLLDNVEENSGPHQAQSVLAFLSRLFNWYSGRDDDFLTPIRRGMTRAKPQDHARDRILDDDEIRAVWRAAEAFSGPYGYLVRFMLLTATRRSEAAQMAWQELTNGDWIIPAARMKAKFEHVIPLSLAARALIDSIPQLGSHVFTLTGACAIDNFSKDKQRLDEACGVKGWRLHDLRRSARSLMSRAAVEPDHAERCLAHTIGGVRGVYDRYAYHKEKKEAFEALAAQVKRILNSATT
jgi:integrase